MLNKANEVIMKIRRNNSLRIAERVLKELEKLNDENQLKDCWIECFDNCREQGYVLKWYLADSLRVKNIAFAQNRNSDAIVVYIYEEKKFSSNLPNENGWDNFFFFNYDKEEDVAMFIMNYIVTVINFKPKTHENV